MVTIALFSAENGASSTKTSTGFIAFVLRAVYPGFEELSADAAAAVIESLHLLVRKCAHFSIYALLGCFVSCASLTFICRKWKRPVVSLAICVAYAISDEIHQYFVPARACAATDVLIDSCGAALGICFAIFLLGYFLRRHIISAN